MTSLDPFGEDEPEAPLSLPTIRKAALDEPLPEEHPSVEPEEEESDDGLDLWVEDDLPDPAALLLQMREFSEPAAERWESETGWSVPERLERQPVPADLPEEERWEPVRAPLPTLSSLPDPGQMYEALEGVEEDWAPTSSAELLSSLDSEAWEPVGWEEEVAGLSVGSLPDPQELFRRIHEGEEEPGGLPALPDLDALKAELEAEERARLDADLLDDLSGPERFAETVSDFDFRVGSFFQEPVADLRRDKSEAHRPGKTPPAGWRSPEEEASPSPSLAKPPLTPKPPRSAPPPLLGSSAPFPGESPVRREPNDSQERAPQRSTPVYHPAPAPARKRSASTAIMPQEGSVRAAEPKVNLSQRIAKFKARRRPLSRHALSIITRQLSAMIKAGIPLHQAVAFCAESDPVAAPMLQDVCNKIETGYSLSGALKEYPESFDAVYVGLVHSGELSGRLNEMLGKLADILEREVELRKRMISVVTYPSVLLAVSMLGTLGFIFFVLPQLTPLFLDLKVDLPWPTKVLLGLRTVLLPATVVGGTLGLTLFLARSRIAAYIQARPALERRLASIPLSLPVLGGVFDKMITARVLYSLATMLEVGVTMGQALARAEGATGNAYVGYRLARARLDLVDGSSVTECFANHRVFPETALQLIAAGEESARLVDMFTYVAKHFDEEVESSMDAAAGLLEPLIMVVMGLIVGFITIAAALPTIHLLQNFG